jgi:hypothetical protein
MVENKLAVFEGKKIRKTIHNNEWWFSIIDVIEVLTDSSIPKRYWSDLKRKLVTEGYSELYEKIVQLKFAATDGKFYATDCANTETMFRIIQSIPSPKVEPLKRWLAKVGKERIDEIEDPQLTRDRDSKGFVPLKKDAKEGGAVAGRTRKDIEKRSGKKVVSSENFKELSMTGKRRIKE